MGEFGNKVAVVTGGTRGIGRAIVAELVRRGCAVVVNHRENEEKARDLDTELRKSAARYLIRKADVRDINQMKSLMQESEQKFGKIRFVINNAGINRDKMFKNMDAEMWNEVIATNLTGVFNTCKAALDHMALEEGSRIVNISSLVGEVGNVGQTNYAAAKAGLIGFTKSLAKELSKYRITVNAVAPGFTDTGMFYTIPEEIRAKIIESLPFKRLVKAEEIASAVCYLLSSQADDISGTVLDVNGGFQMS